MEDDSHAKFIVGFLLGIVIGYLLLRLVLV